VARKTKNPAQPATEKKLRLLMRQIPGSSSGALSCFGFFIGGDETTGLVAVPEGDVFGVDGDAAADDGVAEPDGGIAPGLTWFSMGEQLRLI
jgi:hypothetical protein